jgi:farnesyl diphosphate synthase
MRTAVEPPSFDAWARSMLARFEHAADRQLPAADRVPARLHEAMRYAVLDGGKRVRPLLVYAAGEVSGADAAALDCAALAVEYVHAYSLIHDDLPCMDDDVLRRGKPTVHVAFDEATAMLAGDALQAEAFRVLADAPLPPATRAALMRELAHAAGTEGMCGGQAIDLAAVGQTMSADELERMHRMKTGALLHAAVRMGALAGEVGEAALAAIDTYGRAIGLAFQIVDDVLDVEGSSEVLGKTAGKDARHAKPTYVSVLGLGAAKARAERLRVEAVDAISRLGASARRLRQLADFIVLRSH